MTLREVATVTVDLPSLKPYQGLQFVDTPGLDGVFKHNERTSYKSIRMELQALTRECTGQTRPWIMKRMEELCPDVTRRLAPELQFK